MSDICLLVAITNAENAVSAWCTWHAAPSLSITMKCKFTGKSRSSFWDSLLPERHCLSICACIWHSLKKQLFQHEPLRFSVTDTGELLPVSVVCAQLKTNAPNWVSYTGILCSSVTKRRKERLWVGICVLRLLQFVTASRAAISAPQWLQAHALWEV